MIKLSNITKSFETPAGMLTVLNDLSLNIEAGKVHAVTGQSGAGKSTLLHIIGGLDMPTSGKVLFNGDDVYAMNGPALDKYRNKNIGFIFQFHYLLDDFSALENVTMPALLAGKPTDVAHRRAEELLVRIGLQDRLAHYPKELSGGEQQRVAVARAIMNEPSLILADEPTGNLDRAASEVVQELLFSLKAPSVAVIIVTHAPNIARLCDTEIKLEKA
ncbi:ABC transporter ATP-binding protein [Deferribacterales bacterium RsTz2092]|nr:lipoprotein-releasing system ATP-binding protein LolD [Deferribacterales bacterium]